MIKARFVEVFKSLDHRIKYELDRFVAHPTERNSCYMTGYISAYYQLGSMTREQYTYLLALIPKLEESTQVRKEVLEWMKC